jgi:hypothetical protein
MKLIAAGVQRTGTNFCTQIMKQVVPDGVTVLETGDRSLFWKHAMPLETGRNYSRNYLNALIAMNENLDVGVVLVSKHPVWWISSLLNRDSADLSSQRRQIFSDGKLDLQKACTFYVDFYRSWLELEVRERILPVSYHQVLDTPEILGSLLGERFGVQCDNENMDIGAIKVPYSRGGLEERKGLYEGPFDLSDELVDEILGCFSDQDKKILFLAGQVI